MTDEFFVGDCLDVMSNFVDDQVDLVFGSPPYVNARTYAMDFNLTGQDWVDWMIPRVVESLRICKGLVAFVVEGRTANFRWDATPALLMADLHRAGVHLRKPPAYCRVGIPGSGGPDWWRNDYEFVVCCTSGGKLPWSDNVAMGQPPKYETGGACSNRNQDGQRANSHGSQRLKNRYTATRKTPSEYNRRNGAKGNPGYAKPKIANPGNLIKCKVGKGHMGDDLAHKNEAPFPERLAEYFVRSFCPEGGIVLDPFVGSGTTCAVAMKNGRQYIGIDVRESQIELCQQRLGQKFLI